MHQSVALAVGNKIQLHDVRPSDAPTVSGAPFPSLRSLKDVLNSAERSEIPNAC
ncbi:MAG: hypothetical protein R3A47_10765 [Polyangiales bacterium]